MIHPPNMAFYLVLYFRILKFPWGKVVPWGSWNVFLVYVTPSNILIINPTVKDKPTWQTILIISIYFTSVYDHSDHHHVDMNDVSEPFPPQIHGSNSQTLFNGNFRNLNCLVREYPNKILPYMVLTYLYFRILKISHWIVVATDLFWSALVILHPVSGYQHLVWNLSYKGDTLW